MSAYEKNKFVDAINDKLPGPPEVDTIESGAPEPTPQEIAEQARRDDEARPHARDRDDLLVSVGRAQQTTGR